MAKATRDIGASVRAKLLNFARERGQVLDLLLTRYALERLLYRLSLSAHRNRFVLKGAMLVTTWFEDPHRPTRDLDLLGYGDPSAEAMSIVWWFAAGATTSASKLLSTLSPSDAGAARQLGNDFKAKYARQRPAPSGP